MYARWIQSIFLSNWIQFFVSMYNSITTTGNDLIFVFNGSKIKNKSVSLQSVQ
jgi:hypothetical protein